MTAESNWSLAEDIRSYWSDRAAHFDKSHGHRITDGPESAAWQSVLSHALGGASLEGQHVLDLACGTGEISRMLLDMGAKLTAVDFAEPMLAQARAKHAGRDWQGLLSDAQILPGFADATFDAAVTRHLVWTLTEPETAFHNWARVLKPGGKLVVFDGDWASPPSRPFRLMRGLAARLAGPEALADRTSGADPARHQAILERLPFAEGLSYTRLAEALQAAGFSAIQPLPSRHIYAWGMRRLPLADWLRLNAARRFALVATRAG
jgi:ubiquinone/menaquinone biosynthesis C-methylase UbiE